MSVPSQIVLQGFAQHWETTGLTTSPALFWQWFSRQFSSGFWHCLIRSLLVQLGRRLCGVSRVSMGQTAFITFPRGTGSMDDRVGLYSKSIQTF